MQGSDEKGGNVSRNLQEFEPLIALLAGRPDPIELDEAALLLARVEYPELNPRDYVTQLDHIASVIADRTEDLSDGRSFLETASIYLFDSLGMRGNNDDYYNPDNSCLNRVLETFRGIPISLCAVFIEVARRLAKPVRGVGLPGHFVVRYDDDDITAFLDPFHRDAFIDEARRYELAQMETPDPAVLEPVDTRYIVMRMINNLRGIYFSRREPEKALRLLEILLAANPASAEEHKQKGVALLQLSRLIEAMESLKKYLELFPAAPDRERVEEQIKSIAFWMAARISSVRYLLR
jgi:regulator of sirC expression with transglutaminase-like and TPR domain